MPVIRPPLEATLTEKVRSGKKLLIPYLMAGQDDQWAQCILAAAAAGADAIEVGLPFSDPIMDGPVIQAAGVASLGRGTTPESVLATLSTLDVEIPLVVMTYYNLVFRAGLTRMANELVAAGVSGVILADLSMEELDPWEKQAVAVGLDTVLLVAPSTPTERTIEIAERASGFIYAVGTMGVTGERAAISGEAAAVVAKVRPHTTLPICVGIGVSNGDQAREVCESADGVVVGSAIVRRIADGEGPEGVGRFVASLRSAIDR